MIYRYYDWVSFRDATDKLMADGESLVSPGYFRIYGVSRQTLEHWIKRDNLVRQYNCYISSPNRADISLIPVSDVVNVLKNKGSKFNIKKAK